MYVAFTQSRGGGSNEPELRLEFLQCCGANVTHPAPESANQLVRQRAQLALVGHASFDALRHGLASFLAVLDQRVAVRASFHRSRRTHSSIRLERAPLVENGFSGRLFGA